MSDDEPTPDDDGDHAPVEVPYDDITVPSPKEKLDADSGTFEETYDGVELNAYQRRAVLLDRVLEAGHPRALDATQEELADEFDVSQSTISDDLQILAEWCGENLTREHFGIMDAVFRGAVKNLVEADEYRDAAKVGTEWFDWLADVGAVNRTPDRLDLDVNSDDLESASYEIIPDSESNAEGTTEG